MSRKSFLAFFTGIAVIICLFMNISDLDREYASMHKTSSQLTTNQSSEDQVAKETAKQTPPSTDNKAVEDSKNTSSNSSEQKPKEQTKVEDKKTSKDTSNNQTAVSKPNQEATPAPAAAKTEQASTQKNRPELSSKYNVEYLLFVEDEVVRLCNIERQKSSVQPLLNNEILRQASRYKSNDMLQNNYFDHKSPATGFQPWDLASTFNYSYKAYGENIWMTKTEGDLKNPSVMEAYRASVTAQKIVQDWMNSPEHKANILSPNFNKIGVGVAFSDCGRSYATQEFSD